MLSVEGRCGEKVAEKEIVRQEQQQQQQQEALFELTTAKHSEFVRVCVSTWHEKCDVSFAGTTDDARTIFSSIIN
jgi:hypothetical protein